MPPLPRKGILAIAAVVDVALHSKTRPVSAKVLAARQQLPPRHLEPVLQALVRDGLLRGIRGPHGGYALARGCSDITVDDIVRAAGKIEDIDEPQIPASTLIREIVQPALSTAEQAFSNALSDISVAQMVERASTSA
jgi:Rrf2 family protein